MSLCNEVVDKGQFYTLDIDNIEFRAASRLIVNKKHANS